MNSLGAYFGSTRIVQGAGGLGADDDTLASYSDGILGRAFPSPDMPGPLQSFHDGSLGRMVHQYGGGDTDELHAFADGVVGGNPPDSSTPGNLQAYHDGSLGWYDQAPRGITGFGGSLGYANAIGAAAANVLDLGDANVMKELKTALALLAPENTATAEAQKTFTPDWYTNGIWDPAASMLWQYIVSKTPALAGQNVSVTAGNQTYPNATGIGFVVAALAAPQAGTYGPDWTKQNLPALYAWFSAGGGTVQPPYLSLSDKTQGQRGAPTPSIKMSTVALYGLGAVALFGVALVFFRK